MEMKHLIRIIFVISICVFVSSARAQIDSCAFNSQIENLMGQVSQNNIQMHVENLANAGGHETRTSFTAGNEWASAYIKSAFDSLPGLTSVEYDTFFPPQTTPPYDTIPLVNVIATLQGSGDPNQYYIIGGHLDATANLDNSLNWDTDWPTAKAHGADDNATGIAAMLEIARILSDPANAFVHEATIKFIAFGAEERHPVYNNNNHRGSNHFVHLAFTRGDDILGAYITDMIGYNSTGHHYFNIAADTRSRILGRGLLNFNQTYQIGLEANAETFPAATYSDHDQFWLYRFKAVLLIENAPPWQNNSPFYTANPFYHRQTDTADQVNYAQVTKLAKLILGTVACQTEVITGISDDGLESFPKSFALLPNFPNPFNPDTNIRYQLQFGGDVELSLYNVQGQKMRILVKSHQSPGEYSVQWDGRDRDGKAVSSGLYLMSLQFEGQRQTRKALLLK